MNKLKHKVAAPLRSGQHMSARSIKAIALIAVLIVTALLGLHLLLASHAASTFYTAEPENGTLASGATHVSDTSASNGAAVKFPTPLTPPTPPGSPVPLGVPGNWTLKFDDEFNGTSLDTSRWVALNNWNMNNVKNMAYNVSVSGGSLNLMLSSSSYGAAIDSSKYDGAGSNGYLLPVGGYTEARVEFPGSGSTIYNWPAWWASGPNWPAAGENDIAEGFDGSLSAGNYHSLSGANNGPHPAGTWSNSYHVYGVHRMAGKAEVFWDGQLVRSYSTNDNGGGQALLANVGDGNTHVYGAGSVVKVDYVRAWQ